MVNLWNIICVVLCLLLFEFPLQSLNLSRFTVIFQGAVLCYYSLGFLNKISTLLGLQLYSQVKRRNHGIHVPEVTILSPIFQGVVFYYYLVFF